MVIVMIKHEANISLMFDFSCTLFRKELSTHRILQFATLNVRVVLLVHLNAIVLLRAGGRF